MGEAKAAKFAAFKAMHRRGQTFVIGNPWDAGTARILTALGYKALATTSAGYAFSVGRRDSIAGLSRAEILANASAIVEATDLPVSADLEDGFGRAPEVCAQTIILGSEAGLVGGSIEDASGAADDPILEFSLAVDRIRAAAEAAKGRGFLLTARAENHLWGHDDLRDTIRRLQAYSEAGADVLYAPGLPDLDAIRTVCREVDKPVNVVMGLKGPTYSVTELAAVGVCRISVGGSFARAALGALMRAANEVLIEGTFGYAGSAASGKAITEMMSDRVLRDRE